MAITAITTTQKKGNIYMTQENFEQFIKRSGLKKAKVAEVLLIQPWVFSLWCRKKIDLYVLQKKRLEEFCNDFSVNNAYMKQ